MAHKQTDSPSRITCKLCGKRYRAITFSHLRKIHAKVIERIRQQGTQGVALDATSIERQYGYLHQAALIQFPAELLQGASSDGIQS